MSNLDQIKKIWSSLAHEYERTIRTNCCNYLRIICRANEHDPPKKSIAIDVNGIRFETTVETAVFNVRREYSRLDSIKKLMEKDKSLLNSLEMCSGLYYLAIEESMKKIIKSKTLGVDEETIIKNYVRMKLTDRKFYFAALRYVQDCARRSSENLKKIEDIKTQGKKIISEVSGTIESQEVEDDIKVLCSPSKSNNDFSSLSEWADIPELQLSNSPPRFNSLEIIYRQLKDATILYSDSNEQYNLYNTALRDLERRTGIKAEPCNELRA